MPWQYDPSFANSFIAAMNSGRERRLRQRQEQAKAEQEKAFKQALQSNDPNQVRMFDPALAMKMEEAQNEKAQQREAMTQQVAGNLLQQLSTQNPGEESPLQTMGPRLQEMARSGQINDLGLPSVPAAGQLTPEEVQLSREKLQAARLGAKPSEAQKLVNPILEYVQASGDRPEQPGFFERYRSFRLEDARARGVNLNVNTAGDLAKGVVAKTQEKVLDARESLRQIDLIDSSIEKAGGHDALSSFAAQGEETFKGVLSRIKPSAVSQEDRKRLQARSDAIANLGQFSNGMISKLGGANVPPNEFKRLVESLPRPEDYPWARKAKLDMWKRYLNIIDKGGVDALVNGMNAGVITPEEWSSRKPQKKEMPTEMPTAEEAIRGSGVRPDQRQQYMELRRQGLTKEQALEQLQGE